MELHRQIESYRVPTYLVNSNKQMTIPALVQLMHETAMQHVLRLKVSVWDLEKQDISWVLHQLQLEVTRIPILGEQLRIETFPSGFEKLLTYRTYRVFDQEDRLIATASTSWLVMNLRTRRVARIPKNISDLLLKIIDTIAEEQSFQKIVLPAMKQVDRERLFTVNWHDLDFNDHLSNVTYLNWMLEALEPAVLKQQQLVRMAVNFKLEANYNDQIHSQLQVLPNGNYRHSLVRAGDQGLLAEGISTFSS